MPKIVYSRIRSLWPMKILILTLFLSFFIFASCITFAGNNTLTVTYPATSGFYNKVTLNTQATTNIDCTNPKNAGLLFTSGGILELCATNYTGVNPGPVTVPFGETCYNRFANAPTVPACPAPYVQAKISGVPITDAFQTDASHTVNSVVCCYNGSAVLPL